ncbi:MAG: hypothetical protein U9P10_10250 [Thermodesulfobacteriota bacterium]|nr:hypothetical protein [Thermodesulfobacteriota bacterium]
MTISCIKTAVLLSCCLVLTACQSGDQTKAMHYIESARELMTRDKYESAVTQCPLGGTRQ